MAKPALQERTLVSEGVEDQTSFGISSVDQAHIMRILRDQLYSDRIMAVLREYCSNAWDANRMAGNGDVPIKVSMPTDLQPYLKIRDFGPGLSKQEVFTIYTQYGASTKRDSNDAVGMLGIGSKSAFSYTSSFGITSWHNGTKSIYNASLDERDIGIIQLLHEEDSDEPNGVEIKVPIQEKDFSTYEDKAAFLFRYFKPRPDLNVDLYLTDDVEMEFDNGLLLKRDWYMEPIGVLGCVPYKIDAEVMRTGAENCGIAPKYIGLKFEIGEADFSANREELKYTDRTIEAIRKRCLALAEEIFTKIAEIAKDQKMNDWEKRCYVEEFVNRGVSRDETYKKLGMVSHIPFDNDHKVLKFADYYRQSRAEKSMFMLLIDDDRDIRGFQFNDTNALRVKIKAPHSVDVAEDELKKYLAAAGFGGMPIKRLSSFEWRKPPPKNARRVSSPNPKHRRKSFLFKPKNKGTYSDKQSDNWEISDEAPSNDDVFVLLEKFTPVTGKIGYQGYVKTFEQLKEIADLADVPFPKIRGYKTTDAKPVDPSKLKGTEFDKWVEDFVGKLVKNEKIIDLLQLKHWKEAATRKNIDTLIEKYRGLGLEEDHGIIQYLSKIAEASKTEKVIPKCINNQLIERIFVPECRSVVLDLEAKYPLIKKTNNNFWYTADEDWVDYIKMKDAADASEA